MSHLLMRKDILLGLTAALVSGCSTGFQSSRTSLRYLETECQPEHGCPSPKPLPPPGYTFSLYDSKLGLTGYVYNDASQRILNYSATELYSSTSFGPPSNSANFASVTHTYASQTGKEDIPNPTSVPWDTDYILYKNYTIHVHSAASTVTMTDGVYNVTWTASYDGSGNLHLSGSNGYQQTLPKSEFTAGKSAMAPELDQATCDLYFLLLIIVTIATLDLIRDILAYCANPSHIPLGLCQNEQTFIGLLAAGLADLWFNWFSQCV